MGEDEKARWHVSGEAARTLAKALANPPEPNEALLAAAKRFAALIASKKPDADNA